MMGAQGVADFSDFLHDLEDGYWQEMYNYIKSLGAKSPISGTQLSTGSGTIKVDSTTAIFTPTGTIRISRAARGTATIGSFATPALPILPIPARFRISLRCASLAVRLRVPNTTILIRTNIAPKGTSCWRRSRRSKTGRRPSNLHGRTTTISSATPAPPFSTNALRR